MRLVAEQEERVSIARLVVEQESVSIARLVIEQESVGIMHLVADRSRLRASIVVHQM